MIEVLHASVIVLAITHGAAGLVPCPHAYRDQDSIRFCRMADWEPLL